MATGNMKFSLITNLFGRSEKPAISETLPADTRQLLRDNLSPDHIRAVNAQIERFSETKRTMDRVLGQNDEMKRSYDAATTTNWNRDFRGTYTSANAEIISSDYTVRARARTIAKDTPHGKATLRTVANNVIGWEPFKLEMRYGTYQTKKNEATGKMDRKFVQDVELNEAIEKEWRIFGRPKNFTVKGNMSRMSAWMIMEMSAFRDGFILQKHHDNFKFNPFGYAVELLECDRLQTQYYGKSERQNPIRFSIEFDKETNRVVGYWILSMHPGDAFGQSQMAGFNMAGYPFSGAKAGTQLFRVFHKADDILLYNNLMYRAEQDVGFTELDASVQALWRMFQYEKALTYAAMASCMKVFWYKKMMPTGLQLTPADFDAMVQNFQNQGLPGYTNQDQQKAGAVERQMGNQPNTSTQTPGDTLNLPYGLELMQTDPKFPIEAAHEFKMDGLREVAVANGIRYQDISGDFQNLGFAAALMCSGPAQDNYMVRQQNFLDSAVRPTFEKWLRSTILSGRFEKKYPGISVSISKLEDYVEAAEFQGRRWEFVNPLVQAQTLIIMLEAGIVSPQQVQKLLPYGKSIEDLYTEIGEANEDQATHGLYFGDADVTRPTISKGEPGEVKPKPEEQNNLEPNKPKTKLANPVRAARQRRFTMDLIANQGDGTDRNGNGTH
jgi:capsid protein